MVDVRGDVLRPPHGTTPAAVKSNKNKKLDPLRAMKTFIRRKVDHTTYEDFLGIREYIVSYYTAV